MRIRKLYAAPMGLVPGAFQHQESVLANRRELGDAHVHVGGLERHLLDELPLSLGAFHVVTVDQRAAGCGGDVLAAGRIVLEGVLVADHDLMAGRRYRQRFQALVVHGLSPAVDVEQFRHGQLVLLTAVDAEDTDLRLLMLAFRRVRMAFGGEQEVAVRQHAEPLIISGFAVVWRTVLIGQDDAAGRSRLVEIVAQQP